MLEAVDQRTAPGRRDYSVLLLLVTYSLPAHEVAKLTLDDIDRKRERLQIPERKAGHWTAYPLANVVAEALVARLDAPGLCDCTLEKAFCSNGVAIRREQQIDGVAGRVDRRYR